MTGDQLEGETYRDKCHVNGCPIRFIGINREEYIGHLRDVHGELEADIWETLVITNAK